MKIRFPRTIGSELTFWLSVITAVIAVVIGLVYYLSSAHLVSRKLVSEAQETAEELSQVLALPLYNFDRVGVSRIVEVYLASGRIRGVKIEATDMGLIYDNVNGISSSLPVIQKTIKGKNLELGSILLIFDDRPVAAAKKRAVWTMVVSVLTIILIYILSLRVILRRILITPLNNLGSRLQEIAEGTYDGRLNPVSQDDLNNIISAANRMSDEIAVRTRTLIENERNYREIYNSTSDAILIHDAEDGAIVDVNQAMLDMYGYIREEVMALGVGDLSQGVPPYSQEEAIVFVEKAINDGPQLFEWSAKRKDGTQFWVEVALKKTRIGDFDVVLAVVRDISERKELEEKLGHAQKMEAIGTLAGGIAHDFNNILTAILGYTDLARLKADSKSELLESLQQVKKASERARELVQQILTFSRKQEHQKEVLELEPIVSETMKLLRSSIPTTVEIEQNLSSRARIIGDPGQMHQLIMNLCTNGYQAMPDSTGTLSVSLKDVVIDKDDNDNAGNLEPGPYVVLEVRDNGTGMDAAIKNKIFEPYFSTKIPGKGTGLGLSTVYGIVQSHNGHISVDTQHGKGTAFYVYLPVTDDEPAVRKTLIEEVPLTGNKRVMLVDDDEIVRKLMKKILVHGGYQVDNFENGSAAWDVLSESPETWDLLITDQTMPEMTGVDLARKVLQVRPDMPVILCSGYSEVINGEQALEIGIRVFLQKPVTMHEMLAAAAQALSTVHEV